MPLIKPFSIDHSFGLTNSTNHHCAIIFGWVAGPLNSRYVVVEKESSKPSLVKSFFWARSDVEELFGPCVNPLQRGYGFCGVFYPAEISEQSFMFVAAADNEVMRLGDFSVKRTVCAGDFMRRLFELPVPWDELEACYEEVLMDVVRSIRLTEAHSARALAYNISESKEESPLISVIINISNVPLNLEALAINLFKQDLAQNMEIIYVTTKPRLNDKTASALNGLRHLSSVSSCWLRPVTYGEEVDFLNLAARQARGKYLVFIDQAVLAIHPDFFSSACANLESVPHVWGCDLGLKDVYGNLVTRHNETRASNNDFPVIMVRKNDFITNGGLPFSYSLAAHAWQDTRQSMASKGRQLKCVHAVDAIIDTEMDDEAQEAPEARRKRVMNNLILKSRLKQHNNNVAIS